MTTEGDFQIQPGISIDLSIENFKTVQNFIQNIYFDTKKTKITFNTGEYGMVLFNILVNNELDKKGFIRNITTNIVPVKEEIKVKEQYIIYKLHNGVEIRILHKPELDKKENINEETGFPKKSSRLYYES